MLSFFKKVVGSKFFRLAVSLVLIYFAFRKINIGKLFTGMQAASWWMILLLLIYISLLMFLAGVRWASLVLPKPNLKDFWNFTKASYNGSFYALFFPSAIGGDVLKWLPLMEKYPKLSKATLAGSVLIDRVIGFTAFSIEALLALLIGRWLNYPFPDTLLWLFGLITLGVVVFYILVFTIDFDKFFGRFKFLGVILEVVDLLKNENKMRILVCLALSAISEPLWLLPNYFYGLIFGAGTTLLNIFIFLPVISLILVLPISIAGFGARENLFLLFFSQLGIPDEKILLMSTLNGIIVILNSLVGGLTLLF